MCLLIVTAMSTAKPIRVGRNAQKRAGNPNPGKEINLRKLIGTSALSETGPLGRIPEPVFRETTENLNAVNAQGNRGISEPAATTSPGAKGTAVGVEAVADPVAGEGGSIIKSMASQRYNYQG
jgi:hypothetical protein